MENLKGHQLPSSHHLLSPLPPSDLFSPPPKSCFQWNLSSSSSPSSSATSSSSAIAAASDSSNFRFPWTSDATWTSTTASDPLSSSSAVNFHGASRSPRRDVADFRSEKKYDGIIDCFNPNLAVSELGSATTAPMSMSFSCKLDALAGAERQFGLPALGCGPRSFDKVEIVGDRSSGSFLPDSGDGGGLQACVVSSKKEERDSVCAGSNSGGAVTIASLEDGSIGLKLGKRTYYEDASVEAMETHKRPSVNLMSLAASNGSTAAANSTSPTSIAPVKAKVAIAGAGVANKRQKNSSLSSVVPKCQAEGCTADLSGAKDYHRRHKVCELHSKASKAMVANLEQRFCQQCSRFHVLSEFDEGKRSCRRRLAGHNERRRKPPQEPMPFLSPGFAFFGDNRINALLENPYYMQARRAVALGSTSNSALSNAALACQLGLAGLQQAELDAESIRSYPAVELHRLLRSCVGGGHQPDAGGRPNGMVGSNGHFISNQPPPPSSVASSVQDLLTNSQPSPETAISGRALSLLSSSLGSQVGSRSMSTSLGMNMNSASPTCLDQLFSDFQASSASRHSEASPMNVNGNAAVIPGTYCLRPHNLVSGLHSLTSSSSGCSLDMDEGKSLTMSSFDQSRSTFSMLQDNDFDNNIQHSGGSSGHGRQILDLMQISSIKDVHRSQQQGEVSYGDLNRFSIFGRTSIL